MQIDSRRKTNQNSVCKYHDVIIAVTSSVLKYDLAYNLIFPKKSR